MVKKRKIAGAIISKDYQKKSNNYKLKIIVSDKQKFFFYSQQKQQGIIHELEVNRKYYFYLFKGNKYWFLESWERVQSKKGKFAKETPEWLSKRKRELAEFSLKILKLKSQVKSSESLENRINQLKEQIKKVDSDEELIFLENLEQFIDLILVSQLSISSTKEKELTNKQKKEREILDKVVQNWFYKT